MRVQSCRLTQLGGTVQQCVRARAACGRSPHSRKVSQRRAGQDSIADRNPYVIHEFIYVSLHFCDLCRILVLPIGMGNTT